MTAHVQQLRSDTEHAAPLPRRQGEVLLVIAAHLSSFGYAPTLREIGWLMDIRSTNGVNDHLAALERKGLIRRGAMKARALVVTDAGFDALDSLQHPEATP